MSTVLETEVPTQWQNRFSWKYSPLYERAKRFKEYRETWDGPKPATKTLNYPCNFECGMPIDAGEEYDKGNTSGTVVAHKDCVESTFEHHRPRRKTTEVKTEEPKRIEAKTPEKPANKDFERLLDMAKAQGINIPSGFDEWEVANFICVELIHKAGSTSVENDNLKRIVQEKQSIADAAEAKLKELHEVKGTQIRELEMRIQSLQDQLAISDAPSVHNMTIFGMSRDELCRYIGKLEGRLAELGRQAIEDEVAVAS